LGSESQLVKYPDQALDYPPVVNDQESLTVLAMEPAVILSQLDSNWRRQSRPAKVVIRLQ
jgi:hypothetical protein